MEFAAGIPGSMGGAVTMNAGAYGGEMKDVIRQVTVLPRSVSKRYSHGGTGSVLPAQLYSQESFSGTGGRVVPDAGTGAGDPCKDGRTQGKRVEKQPLEYPSAGSTFKRPEGYFAGKLIMDAGLRGYAVGDAQVSKTLRICDKQRKCHRSRDFAADERCTGTCEKQSGVTLEPEVKMIGEF